MEIGPIDLFCFLRKSFPVLSSSWFGVSAKVADTTIDVIVFVYYMLLRLIHLFGIVGMLLMDPQFGVSDGSIPQSQRFITYFA